MNKEFKRRLKNKMKTPKNLEEDKIKIYGRNIIIILLATLKSIWDAIIGVVWGISGIFLLIGLIGYFKAIPDQSIISLLESISVISSHWKECFIILLLWYLFINLKERKVI